MNNKPAILKIATPEHEKLMLDIYKKDKHFYARVVHRFADRKSYRTKKVYHLSQQGLARINSLLTPPRAMYLSFEDDGLYINKGTRRYLISVAEPEAINPKRLLSTKIANNPSAHFNAPSVEVAAVDTATELVQARTLRAAN
jgi:hypothetical protein